MSKFIKFFHQLYSCGDGTLGTPDQKGDNDDCRNMKLHLRQQQRVTVVYMSCSYTSNQLVCHSRLQMQYYFNNTGACNKQVLLGRSEVSGWGAFLKVSGSDIYYGCYSFSRLLICSSHVQNSVAKDEYLGEYTGELISHHEADKRGKIYDRENSSFLFNLNDEV